MAASVATLARSLTAGPGLGSGDVPVPSCLNQCRNSELFHCKVTTQASLVSLSAIDMICFLKMFMQLSCQPGYLQTRVGYKRLELISWFPVILYLLTPILM